MRNEKIIESRTSDRLVSMPIVRLQFAEALEIQMESYRRNGSSVYDEMMVGAHHLEGYFEELVSKGAHNLDLSGQACVGHIAMEFRLIQEAEFFFSLVVEDIYRVDPDPSDNFFRISLSATVLMSGRETKIQIENRRGTAFNQLARRIIWFSTEFGDGDLEMRVDYSDIVTIVLCDPKGEFAVRLLLCANDGITIENGDLIADENFIVINEHGPNFTITVADNDDKKIICYDLAYSKFSGVEASVSLLNMEGYVFSTTYSDRSDYYAATDLNGDEHSLCFVSDAFLNSVVAWLNHHSASSLLFDTRTEFMEHTFVGSLDDADSLSFAEGETDMKVVTINLLDPAIVSGPAKGDDSAVTFSTNEDTAFTTTSVLGNDMFVYGDKLNISGVDTDCGLSLATDKDGGTFDYDPSGAFEDVSAGDSTNGSFSYTISGDDDTAALFKLIGLDANGNVIDSDGNDSDRLLCDDTDGDGTGDDDTAALFKLIGLDANGNVIDSDGNDNDRLLCDNTDGDGTGDDDAAALFKLTGLDANGNVIGAKSDRCSLIEGCEVS